MEKANCGHCNWHDESQQGKTYCFFDDQWHDVNHSCGNFVKYSYINREMRSDRAKALKKNVEDQEKEQRERKFTEELAQKDRKHAEELACKDREHNAELAETRMAFDKKLWRSSWWWQITLFLLGIGATLFVQLLTK